MFRKKGTIVITSQNIGKTIASTKAKHSTNNLDVFLQLIKQELEEFLIHLLPRENNSKLTQAIKYATLNGGKRLRPALIYATGFTLGIKELSILNAAAASIELIHCYSLVHDDLPAMDNDDFRRGKPSTHKAFDEATAILTGDALQTLAFEILSNKELNNFSADTRINMVNIIAKAAGMNGMILGQMEDLAAENNTIHIEQLKILHKHKTGSLIKAAIQLGISAANCVDKEQISALLHYGNHIGLAFQIHDDILDITADPNDLGKPINSDQRNNKSTFPSLMGLEEAKHYARSLQLQAIDSLNIFGSNADHLRELALYFINRKY